MHISVLHFCVLMDHKFNWFRYSWFLSSSSFLFLSTVGTHAFGELMGIQRRSRNTPKLWRTHGVCLTYSPSTARWPSSPESKLTIRWQNKTLGPLCHQRASIIIKLLDGYCVVVVAAAGPSLPSSRLTVWTATAARQWASPRPRGDNKINPSSQHSIVERRLPITTLSSGWFERKKNWNSTQDETFWCKRVLPILISPFKTQKKVFFSLWSHDHFHQQFF